MEETRYVCTGSCKGNVSEKEWEEGAKVCGMEDCEEFDAPLEKMVHCLDCDDYYIPGHEHSCGGE